MKPATQITDDVFEENTDECSGTALNWVVTALLKPRGLSQSTKTICFRFKTGLRHYSANRRAVDLSQTKLMEELIATGDRQIDLSLGINPTNTRAGARFEYDVVTAIRTLVGKR